MCELPDILLVDFEILSAHGIFQAGFCAVRSGCLYSARACRIEEPILPFRGMGCKRWRRSEVFLFQIVPLVLSARTRLLVWPLLPVCLYFARRGRGFGGRTSTRRRKYHRHRTATRAHIGGGRRKYTRPRKSADAATLARAAAHIYNRIGRTGEQKRLVF